ncbi:hypothetical protein J6590_105616, partial [Homalodisca vitripennis]
MKTQHPVEVLRRARTLVFTSRQPASPQSTTATASAIHIIFVGLSRTSLRMYTTSPAVSEVNCVRACYSVKPECKLTKSCSIRSLGRQHVFSTAPSISGVLLGVFSLCVQSRIMDPDQNRSPLSQQSAGRKPKIRPQKKSPNPYLNFTKVFLTNYGGEKKTQVERMKEAAGRWRQMGDQERRPYIEMAAAAKRRRRR